jgi:hypothetical protein
MKNFKNSNIFPTRRNLNFLKFYKFFKILRLRLLELFFSLLIFIKKIKKQNFIEF